MSFNKIILVGNLVAIQNCATRRRHARLQFQHATTIGAKIKRARCRPTTWFRVTLGPPG